MFIAMLALVGTGLRRPMRSDTQTKPPETDTPQKLMWGADQELSCLLPRAVWVQTPPHN
jgi:hypothetical protein